MIERGWYVAARGRGRFVGGEGNRGRWVGKIGSPGGVVILISIT